MYNRDREFRPKFAPVKVGDELDVTIDAVGEKGDGIAKKEGFVLFVPNTKKGDNVKIRVTRVLRNVGFAEVAGQSESSEGQQNEESSEEYDAGPAEEPKESDDAEDSEDFGEEFEEKT